MALFEVQNLSFTQGGKHIVNDVSLTIEKGTVSGFIGKSGCGKTTLIKLISGILVPTAGKSLYNGQDIQTMTKAQNLDFRKRCSFVFQDSALWANQDILQNMTLPLKIHFPKMSLDEQKKMVQEVLESVNFHRPLNLRPADLSMGEQKKVAFARSIICKPEILFLDEVTTGLDVTGCEKIENILRNFLNEGNTLVYVSHNSEFIEKFPGNLHIIEEGALKGISTNVRRIEKLIRDFDAEDAEDADNTDNGKSNI